MSDFYWYIIGRMEYILSFILLMIKEINNLGYPLVNCNKILQITRSLCLMVLIPYFCGVFGMFVF